MTWKIKFIPFPNQNQFALNLVMSEPCISRGPAHLAISPSLVKHGESLWRAGLAHDESASPVYVHNHDFVFRKKELSIDRLNIAIWKALTKIFFLKRHHQAFIVSKNPLFEKFLSNDVL